MKSIQKSIERKSLSKRDRQLQVLLALVDLYIRTEKPISSNTLRESDLQQFSSATLRNYFTSLEEEGFLRQLHSSGGRIPTQKAYRAYAEEWLKTSSPLLPLKPEAETALHHETALHQLRSPGNAEVSELLERGAELLSQLSGRAVFLSAPKFDHDLVTDLKLVSIDQHRCLCAVITSFGMVKTEILYLEEKLHLFDLKRIESYFQWRLSSRTPSVELSEEETLLANRLYNEIMVRYLVGYTHFSEEEIYRTGLSQLLHYPEYKETSKLAHCLALFEDPHKMRLLLRECTKIKGLKYWIGDELPLENDSSHDYSVLAVPYYVGPRAVGAIAILGPLCTPYPALFSLLQSFSEALSEGLTNRVYRFGITYRQPYRPTTALSELPQLLLENKRS